MATIDIIALFGNDEGARLNNLDVYEVNTDLGDKEIVLDLGQASLLCDLWASQGSFARGWTIPDTEGEYDGIVLAAYDDRGPGISLTVWDAYDLGRTIDGPVYRLDQFPYSIRVEVR